MASRTSIALATHNGERYLREQLVSFAAQTTLPDELIVSDDASDDATVQILNEFARTAPFKLKILPFTDRLGYAGNFNRALLTTTGDLVFLSDQDDVWFPTKLETVLAEARAHPDAMVLMNDVSLTDSSLEPAGITKLEQFRSAGISIDKYLMGAAAAVRREYLEAVLPVPPDYPAHDDWIIKLAIGIGRRHLLPIPLQYYRIHDSNTSAFRVNSLRRVSALSVSRSRLDQLLRGRPLEIDSHRLARLTLESSGAKRAGELASGQLSMDFDRLAHRLSDRMIVMQKRLIVRSLPRVERIGKIRELLKDGGYSAYRGYASALLDFLAPVAP